MQLSSLGTLSAPLPDAPLKGALCWWCIVLVVHCAGGALSGGALSGGALLKDGSMNAV